MVKTRYHITYELKITSPRCFCGAGYGAGGVDRTFMRDINKNMFIPGSQIKGIIRNHCEDLLKNLGSEVTDTHDHDKLQKENSLIVKIFGKPGPNDVVSIFSDVTVKEPQTQHSVIRKSIRMNRMLGKPEPQALFDTEYAIPPVENNFNFNGQITLWLEHKPDTVSPELTLLCAGMRLVDAVGGDKSTGAGFADIFNIEINNEDLMDELIMPISDKDWSRKYLCSGNKS